MASELNPVEHICEGDDCETITCFTYYVRKKMKLCDDCASKEKCIGKARKVDPNISCEKHGEEIRFYCTTHGVPLCLVCALIDHHQPCVLKDIEDSIKDICVAKLCAWEKQEQAQGQKQGQAQEQVKEQMQEAAQEQMQEHAQEEEQDEAQGQKQGQEQAKEQAKEQTQEQMQEQTQEKVQEDAQEEAQEEAQEHMQEQAQEEAQEHMQEQTQEEAQEQGEEQAKEQTQEQTQEQEKTEEKAQEQAQDKEMSYCGQGDKILQCKDHINPHLQAAKDKGDLVIQELTEANKNKEQEDAAKIKMEIDEKNTKLLQKIKEMKDEIRRNEEERKERLELNKITAEKRQEPIGNKQRILHTDIQSIDRKIGDLEKLCKDYGKRTLDTVMVDQDDKSLVKDGHHLEWKLTDKINVRDQIEYPVIVGCIDEWHVIITDRASGHAHTYKVDIKTGHTQRVISGTDTSWVTSCVLLKDDKIQELVHVVCGKYSRGCTEDRLSGYRMYYSQWMPFSDVSIPRKTTLDDAWVDVTVDHNGMVISAELGQSKIYIINPADGKIINTIMCKENMKMLGVLSSGHIIARPEPADRRVFIIDREGAHTEITHSDVIRNACIDHIKDDLYVMTSDDDYKMCVIDQVMSMGDLKKRRVASFPLSTRLTEEKEHSFHLSSSHLIMMPSGEMIACDGDNILIFVKELFSI